MPLLRLIATFVILLLSTTPLAVAEEAIERFGVMIDITADGRLNITEALRVRADGQQIRRGIYRDISRQSAVADMLLELDVQSVTLDGSPVAHHVDRNRKRYRIAMGDPDQMLSRGVHVFMLRYSATWAIAFGQQQDQLNWQITGTDWAFPIENVDVRIALSDGTSLTSLNVMSGPHGTSSAGFAQASIAPDGSGTIDLRGKPLLPGEGLAFNALWPTGAVARPDLTALRQKQMIDERVKITGLIGLMIVLGYYIAIWRSSRVKTAPSSCRTTPPDGLSAAACAVILNRRYCSRAFAAGVVGLAVKGALEICNHKDVLQLMKVTDGAPGDASAGEAALFDGLFRHSDSIILPHAESNKRPPKLDRQAVKRATRAHRRHLRRDEVQFFTFRWPASLVGLGLVGLVIMAMAGSAADWTVSALMLSVIAVVAFFSQRALNARHAGLAGNRVLKLVYGLLIVAAGLIAALGAPVDQLDKGAVIIIALLSLLWLSGLVVKARTPYGARICAEIMAFQAYLKDRYAVRPEDTDCTDLDCPFRFERYLAYAIALGAEDEWNAKYAEALDIGASERGQAFYHPFWFHSDQLGRSGSASIGSLLVADVASAHRQIVYAGSSNGSAGTSVGAGVGGAGGGGF